MVDMAAYENVAIAKQATRAAKEESSAAGIRARHADAAAHDHELAARGPPSSRAG